MPPTIFRATAKPLSGRYLSLAEREEIALLLVQNYSLREIACRIGRLNRPGIAGGPNS